MVKPQVDYLNEIGVQRWYLRESSPSEEPAIAIDKGVNSAETQTTYSPQSLHTANEPEEKAETPLSSPAANPEADHGVSTAPEDSWATLIAELEEPALCAACQASNPILGEGNLDAEWVWIIDAPSSNDIAAQQLVSGRAGQLLDAILNAVDLDRKHIYLTSVFKCPPSDEYATQAGCGGLLRRQVALINPNKVVAFGEFAAQALLRSNNTLEQLRESVHQPRTLGCNVIATHSIHDMIAQPSLKAQVWQDLCRLVRAE